MPIMTKIRNGYVNIPVPFIRRYRMWNGTMLEIIPLDDGLLLKPMVAAKKKNDLIDKYIPRTEQIKDSDIIAIVSEISRQSSKVLVQENTAK
ncbi:MAG: hypothetical protein QXS74_03385 [Nitrososphaeria archaeon]